MPGGGRTYFLVLKWLLNVLFDLFSSVTVMFKFLIVMVVMSSYILIVHSYTSLMA